MITQFYQNIILKNPKSILIILLIALFTFGYYSKDFKLDASSETLLIEGDPDLEYLKEMNIKVTKLAEGVPAGGDLDYVDNNTLKRAFSWRRELGD